MARNLDDIVNKKVGETQSSPNSTYQDKSQSFKDSTNSNQGFFFQEGIDFIEGFSDRFSKPLADAAKTRTIQKAVANLSGESASTANTLNQLFETIDIAIEGINENLEDGNIQNFLSLPSPLPQLQGYRGGIRC
jgi:hypothetical protein